MDEGVPVVASWSVLVDVGTSDGPVPLHALVHEPEVETGAPMLLVHGLASNAQLWTGVATRLAAAGHRVVAVDQRGHGLSAKVDDGYDFATLSADLVAVATAIGIERPVAVGQSWGGNVVLELAARHPDHVRGVACVDGGQIDLSQEFGGDRDAMLEALTPPRLAGMRMADLEAGMASRLADWPAAGLRGQLANFVRRPDGTTAPHLTLDRHLRILDHLWDHHPAARFPLVDVPVLLLPVRGGAARAHAVESAEAGLATVRTHWFEGHHDVHAEQPDLVVEVLRTALDDGFFTANADDRPSEDGAVRPLSAGHTRRDADDGTPANADDSPSEDGAVRPLSAEHTRRDADDGTPANADDRPSEDDAVRPLSAGHTRRDADDGTHSSPP